jgi:molybdopterin-containing oxidoreductase family iron-sulfur binding subunit
MDDNKIEQATTERSDARADATPPNDVTGGPRLSRRRLLRVLGVGALAVIPLPVLPELMRAAGLAEGQTKPVGGHGEAARTRDGRIRQWTMIIDLRACDGCQSVGKAPRCTAACIEGHFAPEPMEWMEVYEAELPGNGTQFVPTPCQQCQNPPCVNVCPVGATFSTPEGTVLIDQDRCIGCRICMASCPYDRRFFNWGTAPTPPEALLADYSPEHQVPARKGTVMKCDFCPDMARTGTLPYCIQGCPNGAIYYGDLEEDIATNGTALVSVSRFLSENDAYRMKEELGTKPRVYYIPGHGEAVGRDAFTPDRQPTEWPWMERAEGAVTWQR